MTEDNVEKIFNIPHYFDWHSYNVLGKSHQNLIFKAVGFDIRIYLQIHTAFKRILL